MLVVAAGERVTVSFLRRSRRLYKFARCGGVRRRCMP
jgi:hypothetical protein